jgi:hypothetical protein
MEILVIVCSAAGHKKLTAIFFFLYQEVLRWSWQLIYFNIATGRKRMLGIIIFNSLYIDPAVNPDTSNQSIMISYPMVLYVLRRTPLTMLVGNVSAKNSQY